MNPGTIREYLEHDHRRLDHLLSCAASDPDEIERGAFVEFRRGLLISMEEKILLPAVQALRHGEPLAIAAQLRL
jgi:hypothetical protein